MGILHFRGKGWNISILKAGRLGLALEVQIPYVYASRLVRGNVVYWKTKGKIKDDLLRSMPSHKLSITRI